MKKKKKVDFSNLKKGECFRLTEKGPIYQKDNSDGGHYVRQIHCWRCFQDKS